MIITTVFIGIFLLLLLALLFGYFNCEWWRYTFQMNTLRTPYYKMGIFYEPLQGEDEEGPYIGSVLTIGLFFINIIIIFGDPTA